MIQSVCCIHQIKENARVDQWHYGLSKENPADYALQELDFMPLVSWTIILMASGSTLVKQRLRHRIIRK